MSITSWHRHRITRIFQFQIYFSLNGETTWAYSGLSLHTWLSTWNRLLYNSKSICFHSSSNKRICVSPGCLFFLFPKTILNSTCKEKTKISILKKEKKKMRQTITHPTLSPSNHSILFFCLVPKNCNIREQTEKNRSIIASLVYFYWEWNRCMYVRTHVCII